jgi:hypothetical protein
MSTWLFGNRTGVRCLAAWVAATVRRAVTTEEPARRQSPSAESKASGAGAEPPGRTADAGQRDKHRGINGSWNLFCLAKPHSGRDDSGLVTTC